MKTSVRRSVVSAFALTAAAALAGCSSSPQSSPPPIASPSPSASLAAATNSICVTPATQAQNVTLPTTGGVSGTLAFGAFTATSSTCITVTLATGADAVLTASRARSTQAAQPNPVLTISLDDAFTQNTVVTGATLVTPSNVVFPDGTYYATLTSGTGTTGLVFTAKNGVLTLASTGSTIIVVPGTTATIALYGPGVVPVFSSNPSPSPTPTATATASAAPSPTPTPTIAPSPSPTPTASAAPYVASVVLTPSTCTQFGSNGGTQTYVATATLNPPPGSTLYYGWFGNGQSVSVPGPTVGAYDPARGIEMTAGTQTSATLTVAPLGGSVVGAGSDIIMTLFIQTPPSTNLVPVLQSDGTEASAIGPWEEGLQLCQ